MPSKIHFPLEWSNRWGTRRKRPRERHLKGRNTPRAGSTTRCIARSVRPSRLSKDQSLPTALADGGSQRAARTAEILLSHCSSDHDAENLDGSRSQTAIYWTVRVAVIPAWMVQWK